MAYQSKEIVLVPGGLNLLADSQLSVPHDSIGLKNWRLDGSGVLRTRLSAGTIGTSFAGSVHTIQRIGNDRWYGVSDKLYVNSSGSLVTTGLDGTPPGLVGMAGRIWVMNQAKQGQVDPGSPTLLLGWLPPPPGNFFIAAQAGGALVDDVEYQYCITFVQNNGSETNPSPITKFTPTGGSGNNTARITKSAASDPQTTGWHVYRLGNTVGEFYRLTRDPIDVATWTWDDIGSDAFSDLEIVRFGVILETDHDPVPAAKVLMGPFFGRMVCANTAAHPNRIFWTPVNQPWYWPVENYADIGTDNDEVVQFALHGPTLRIYLKRAVWRQRGDFSDGSLERTNAEIGLIGPKAIASAGPVDYFQGQEGIYVNDGDQVKKFSQKIDPLFRTALSLPDGADPDLRRLNDDEAYRAKNCLVLRNGRLYFSYYSGSPTAVPDQLLSCNLSTGEWGMEWSPANENTAIGYSALHDEGPYYELLGAGYLSQIYKLEQSLPEANPIKHGWTSGFFNAGQRENKAQWADLVIEYSTQRGVANDRALTVKLKTDNGDGSDLALGSLIVATTASGSKHNTATFPIGTNGKGTIARNVAVTVDGASEYEVNLYSMTLHCYPFPRDSVTFDSDRTTCGDHRPKIFDLMELDIFSNGTVTWYLSTDLPGNAMTQRQTGTFAATGDRVPVPIQVAAEGRLVQLVLTSPSVFWLFGSRLRYRAVGVYLDGTKGNYWESAAAAVNL